MWTRILLGVFLILATMETVGTVSQNLLDLGGVLLAVALFVVYAWESRRGAFCYRPSPKMLLLLGLVLVLVEIAPESVIANFQDRWFLPIVVVGLALYELTRGVREWGRGASRRPTKTG